MMTVRSDLSSSPASAACEGREPRAGADPPTAPAHFILLKHGIVVLVSECDYEELSQFKWHATGTMPHRYAARWASRGVMILMHRQILSLGLGERADHINFNTFDNRRENLRRCSDAQNTYHSRKKLGPSGYRGVVSIRSRWRAQINNGGRKIYLGDFMTPIEAAIVRDEAAKQLHGEFAILNFPQKVL